ncbi:uncharacterized protein JCM15063_005005 [Sporobolomyces koalae]|uniref:uncharacterized protein n=1 Tax=Sporobolomyces koalae TaxID=500713 RepID=UPI0031776F35
MSSLATHLVGPSHGFSTATSSHSSPSSPSFPHSQALSINGSAFHLSLRPGTSSGTITSPTLHTDSSGLDYATLPSWTDQHVATWISHALPTLSSTYSDVFAQNDIRGNVLLEVDQTALKEMGIRSVGDRVKICVAVRALRGKYLSAVGGTTLVGGGNRASVLLSRFTQSRPSSPLVPGSNTSLSSPASVLSTPPGSSTTPLAPPPVTLPPAPLIDPRPGSGSYSARNISVGNRIPPPLHLAQSNVTSPLASSQLQQAQYASVSPPSRTTSPRAGQFASAASAPTAAATTIRQVPPPPTLPPPNSRIPPPPTSSASASNAGMRDWLGEIPGYSSAPSSTINASTSLHASSVAQLRPSTATQPHVATRHKASSASLGARPSTAQASLSSYSGHPYAAPTQSQSQLLPSPLEHPSTNAKSESHQGYTVGRSTFARPSTAGGLVSSSGVIASSVSSTPLSNLDVMRKAVKFTSADGVTTRVLAVGDAKDGREVLSRVVRKFATSAIATGQIGGGSGLLGKDEELDGWGIWTPDPNGMARLLSEQELHAICQNTAAPERARGLFVRKLPTSASAAAYPLPLVSNTSTSSGIQSQQPTSPLQSQSTAASSFSNATSPNKRGRKLQWVFGDSHAASAESVRPGGSVSFTPSTIAHSGGYGTSPTASPTSPNYLGIEIPKMGFEPASPSTSGDGSDFEDTAYRDEEYDPDGVLIISPRKKKSSRSSTGSSGKMNRASTVSVMSGLEAPDWARDYYGKYSDDASSTKDGSSGGSGGAYMASPPQRTSSRHTPPTSHDSMIHPAAAPARRSTTEPHPRSSSPTASIASSVAPSSARKLRNFFGQRPPSELIATHLTEFFPLGLRGSGDKKLSKQVRMSIRKSMGAHALGGGGMGRRMSTTSVASSTRATVGGHPQNLAPVVPGQTSWEKKEESHPMSRFSGSSDGSTGLSHSSQATTRAGGTGGRSPRGSLDPPDESAEDQEAAALDKPILLGDGGTVATSPESTSMALNSSNSSSRSASVTADDLAETRSIASSLAPSYLDARSARLSTRRMSRMSGSSRLSVGAQSLWERRSKDSDAASVITVDEVTAELETRRASGMSWGESYSEDDEGDDESVVASDDDDESVTEESETETSEEEEVEPHEGVPHKPEAKGMKWIKGALIGAGSFGSVYLGMNPLSGSLMAVKQVELPTGKSHNEERKKSMLEALEREIELLKVLQHENIVQYLDSSTDGQHLNIFLEYVPGGSVAALLSNYGAFEEALVSKFVRQILTGLDYLHEREIIHRDIKGANILVDNKGNIKISDFGISKKVEDNLLSSAKVHRPSLQGSVYWMAPEVVKQTAYTSKADIWSLGCLVVEMLTGAHPWANLTQMQAIFRIGSSGRPTVPDDISSEADDFLEQTFEIEHTDRPSARELLAHGFIREDGNLQTPTRATFNQSDGSGSKPS